MKRPRIGGTAILAGVMFILACVFGAMSMSKPEIQVPRARWGDATPLGGKGFQLLFERLGYKVARITERTETIPPSVGAWVILDPQTRFSRREGDRLLRWVRQGGTLVWSCERGRGDNLFEEYSSAGIQKLREELGIALDDSNAMFNPNYLRRDDYGMPVTTPHTQSAVSVYWTGVKKIEGLGNGFNLKKPALEIAGTPFETQIARVDIGKGRAFIVRDALMFTNFGLARSDNAVLITNLIRVHLPTSQQIIVDERNHGEPAQTTEDYTPGILDYLWQPPIRWAILQMLLAGTLWWMLGARRLGAPVPLPQRETVTRASLFARGMGALLRKANRPRAASVVINENFRRELSRGCGLSPGESNALLASRSSEISGLPENTIRRLLDLTHAPLDDETQALHAAQEMQLVLTRMRGEKPL